MIRHLLFIATLLFVSLQSHAAAEIIVKADSINPSGYSNISSDKLTIYGGIAGFTRPVTGSSTSTVDTCADSTANTLEACNQQSVHSGLVFSVSFQVTKDVTNAVAKMYLDTTQLGATVTVSSATANNTVITLETTWSEICSAMGMDTGGTCENTTTEFFSNSLKIGVDSDSSGDVEDAEKKSLNIKLHYIKKGDASASSLAYCTGSAVGTGMCNVEFLPGDQKAFINSALYGGNDSGSVPWESIAVFPVSSNDDLATLNDFLTNQASPVFTTFDADDGTIPDSAVSSGGLQNGVHYCFIYGTKNLAQNIYKFVTSPSAATTACVTPSEVLGLLDDNSCFISTAAFGSDMAPEVQTFRAFRNKFLYTTSLGTRFVKTYYKLSPPVAEVISENEYLRSVVRIALYPFLFFASLALKFGLLAATALFSFLVMSLTAVVRYMRFRKASLMILILLLAPFAKASIVPEETVVQHEGAKEGLVRIAKDGTYIYDTPRAFKSESSKLTFGVANQPDISFTLEGVSGTTGPQTYDFASLYSESSGLVIGYDYEKFLWTNSGRLGYQLGVSLMVATGHGILKSTGQASLESFTFLTMPITAGGVYRFEYKDKQWVVPYVAGGATVIGLFEKRDDKPWPEKAFGGGAYGAGGALFNIAALDPEASFQLDSEYGISNLWLSTEFRVIEASGETFSFSNAYVNAGVSFDF